MQKRGPLPLLDSTSSSLRILLSHSLVRLSELVERLRAENGTRKRPKKMGSDGVSMALTQSPAFGPCVRDIGHRSPNLSGNGSGSPPGSRFGGLFPVAKSRTDRSQAGLGFARLS